MTLKEWWTAHPKSDLGVALVGGALTFAGLDAQAFQSLAEAVTATGGVLLGMAAVVYGLFQQSTSSSVRMVRAAYRTELAANWKAIMFGFIWVCALAMAAMVVFPLAAVVAIPALGFAGTLLLARAARMATLLSLYLTIDKADSLPKLEIRPDIAKR